ncbi:hypothetical protein MAR_007876 [Mya arenaria]|uniref:Uncharacterized protein n=1 Tax=Mya arenaria TaxID=6604 RepID=A0ABY7DUA6_MYAAR|nr:hypothetical protein MAR_007876 [Mya arenaria]
MAQRKSGLTHYKSSNYRVMRLALKQRQMKSLPLYQSTAIALNLVQGYSEHLVTTISEWLVAFVSVIYFSTFYTEFKHFSWRPPKVEYDNTTDTTLNAINVSTLT